MKTLIFFACSAAAFAANADVMSIQWTEHRYEQTATIAPGKVFEACGIVIPEQPVDWKFAASAPLAFNIHRHEKDDVIYASRSYGTREQTGTFAPKQSFEWCWMWTNESNITANLQISMRRKP